MCAFTGFSKYNVIYADPGWKYDNEKTGGSHKSGAAQKYTIARRRDLQIASAGNK